MHRVELDFRAEFDLESVPEGSEAAFVGWVQPTECQDFALVGFTHPTTVTPVFRDGFENDERSRLIPNLDFH